MLMATQWTKGSMMYHEMAIQELAKGHQLVARLTSLLPVLTAGDVRSELAADLSQQLLQTLAGALSALRSTNPQALQVASNYCYGSSHEGSRGKVKVSAARDDNQREQKRRRRNQNSSFTMVTTAPYADGHQWRKYGQKKLNNEKHPRSYYKCIHKECAATKQVQQNDCNDSTVFHVTYNENHTCSSSTKASTPKSEPHFSIVESEELSQGIKQEQHPVSSSNADSKEIYDVEMFNSPADTFSSLTEKYFSMNTAYTGDFLSYNCPSPDFAWIEQLGNLDDEVIAVI